jgi:ActR/RegA family two-component response regulator
MHCLAFPHVWVLKKRATTDDLAALYNPKGPAMNNSIHVLLVDDEETFVRNLARLLRFRGFEVTIALDGYRALKLLRGEPGFDVIVLDVKMPRMDGIATLGQIKRISPEMAVIMLTGHAMLESGIQSIRDGAFDYMMKPCDIEDLSEKIREACEVERIRRCPVLWPRNLIREITWPSFVNLTTRDFLRKALEVFTREVGMPAKESLYILDDDDRFQGTVTRRDLLKMARKETRDRPLTWEALIRNPGLLPDVPLGAVMRPDHPIATNPEENLTQAAQRMIEHHVRCMPVIEDDKVKGFIRLQDIFQHVGDKIARKMSERVHQQKRKMD